MSLSAYVRKASQRIRYRPPQPIQHAITYPQYEPASPQAEAFHASDKHIKYLFGGDRAGKTGTVGYEFISLTRRFPGRLYWAVALTEDKLSAVWKWHKTWLAKSEIKYINWRVTDQIPKFVLLPDGGKIEYKMWKQGPGAFSADSVFAIQLDEDGERTISTAEQVYNDCLSRILDCDGYILGGATPVLGKNWMYHRIFQFNSRNRPDHTQDPDIEHWTVSLLDNKFIPMDHKLKAKGRMSADEIQRRFYGKFTTLEGAVFKEWREDQSVLQDMPPIPVQWRRAAGIDLGYDHPFVTIWGALSSDKKLYIYEEYGTREEIIKTHAAEILRREADKTFLVDIHGNSGPDADTILAFQEWVGSRELADLKEEKFKGWAESENISWSLPELIFWYSATLETRVCDHERQTRAELEHYLIYTDPADKKNKEQNIMLANRIMKEGRLLISATCWTLINQLGTMHYRKNVLGKEEVAKVNDDYGDAFLYLVAYFYGGGQNWNPDDILTG